MVHIEQRDECSMFKREELAWAAGFFDGEGNVHYHKTGNVEITIGQIDKEVLQRFMSSVGVGYVYGPYIPKNKNWNPVYYYKVSGWVKCQHVMAVLWSWLSTIKKEQFRSTVPSAKPKKKRWEICRDSGHAIAGNGRSVRCNTCRRSALAR